MAQTREGDGIVASPAFRAALAVVALLALATYGVYLFVHWMLGREPFRLYATHGVVMEAGDFVIDLPLLYLLFATAGLRASLRWPLAVAGALAVTVAHCCYDTWTRMLMGMIPATPDARYEAWVRSFPINLYNTAMWVALVSFQSAWTALVDHARALGAARAAERASHLAALRLQLNPHFLFNALNALSSLVVLDRRPEAEEMIGRLSGFLRNTLGSDLSRPVRLEDEFETIESYLEIERVRFGDRLDLSIRLPHALADALVPPFMVQPLVENAMKYGVAPSRRAVTVEIAAYVEGAALVLSVSDDGDSADAIPGGIGVGLANVRERLAIAYDGAARLEACGGEHGGYCALIRIPLAAAMKARADAMTPA